VKGTGLKDAKTWRDANAPSQSAERHRYDTAVLRRDGIGKLVREWVGPRSGAGYEALLSEWKAASSSADQAYDAMIAAAMAETGESQ
jgi:hypothetical protein